MPDAGSDRAWRRPPVRLGAAVAVLAIAIVSAWGAPDELGIGSLRLAGSGEEASPAQAELVVVLSGRRGVAPDQAAFDTSQEVVTLQLRSDPAIADVRAVAGERLVSLVIEFGDASSAERQDAAERIENQIDPGALRAKVTGEIVRNAAVRDELEDELWRKQLLAVPLALLILIAGAGWRRAVAPVLCAGIAIAGTLALLRLCGLLADVSLLGFVPAAVVGLVLGIELPLRALRESDAPERDTRLALAVAAVGAVPGFALLAAPLDQAASVAIGAAIAAFLATAATRVVVPAVVLLTADRVPEPALPRPVTVRWRRMGLVGAGLALVALAALAVPLFAYGATTPYTLAPLARELDDSLLPELPVAAAIAGGAAGALLAWLARTPLAALLGPASLLPASAALGLSVFLSDESDVVGRGSLLGDPLLDTGAVATAVCALAAISCARSALDANAFSVGRIVELRPALTSTAIGLLACAALYGTDVDQAQDLAVAVAAGLLADLLLLRLALRSLASRRILARA